MEWVTPVLCTEGGEGFEKAFGMKIVKIKLTKTE